MCLADPTNNVIDMLLVLTSSVVEAPTALLLPAPALMLNGKLPIPIPIPIPLQHGMLHLLLQIEA